MSTIKLSWYRFIASVSVLRQHQILLGISIGTAVFDLLLIGILVLAYFLILGFLPAYGAIVQYALIAGGLVTLTLSGIFSSALIYSLSATALEGERPDFYRSLKRVWHNRIALFQWWLFSVFGLILLTIFQIGLEKLVGLFGEKLGEILETIIGLTLNVSWSLAVYFAVPVLMTHPDKPLPTLKRSASLIKRSWGEKVTLETGQALLGLLFLSAIGIFVVGIHFALLNLTSIQDSRLLYIIDGIIAGPLVVAFFSLMAACDAVYKASLYRFAETGDYVGPFTQAMYKSAFKHSKKSSFATNKI